MAERNFKELLEAQWDKSNFLCVGLDSEYDKIPDCFKNGKGLSFAISSFSNLIVANTLELVCAYKINLAFYLSHGPAGLHALSRIVKFIKEEAPEIPIILDAKFGDVENTSEAYAKAAFDEIGVDAVTVNPYLGGSALEPFLRRRNKGVFVLCRTSNPGAVEFQQQQLLWQEGSELFEFVARQIKDEWNENKNCGLVVGATNPIDLREVRDIVGDDIPLLLPGVGKQGADLEKAVKAGRNKKNKGIIVNASRSIIFASNSKDFAFFARVEAKKLSDEIRDLIKAS